MIWHGPALWRGSSTLIGFLVTALLGRVLAPTFARQRSLLQYLALLLLLSWLLVWIHAENATEADGGCYRHVLAPIIGLTSFTAAFVAPLLAKLLIAWYRGQFVRRQTLIDPNNPPDTLPDKCGSFGDFLPTTEMFFIPVKPKFKAIGFVVSLLPTLTRYALPVCWAAAVAGVLVPQRVMHIWLLVVGAAGVLFFAVGNLLGERFRDMFDRVHRYLFSGAPLAVSLGVIILAFCRWEDFQYVSILLNSTPALFMILLLASCYFCLWQYQLWIREALGEHLLGLLEFPITLRMRASVPYRFDQDNEDPAYATNTLAQNRFVQIHGGGLAVMGSYIDQNDGKRHGCWESYGPFEFFDTLVARAFRRRDVKQAILRYRLALDLLMLGVNTYLAALNLTLVLGIGGAFYYYLRVAEPDPAVKLAQQNPSQPDAAQASSARVTQDEIVQLLMELHPAADLPPIVDPKQDIDRVRSWVQKDPHHDRWKQLREALLHEQN